MTDKTLAGRLAVVTGASRGIGRAAALAYAAAGAHVIAVARTQGALEELDDEIRALGGSATLVPVDLKDVPAIDRLGAAIHERWGKLDILLANGAILGPISPLGHVEPKAWDDIMAVNVTANWRLIRSLDPLLRRSDAGRAIFVTSAASWKNAAYWGPYATSKAALNTLAMTYAAETATTAVKVMLVNPGPLRTRMREMAMPGEDPMTLQPPEALAPHLVGLAEAAWSETGRIFDFPSLNVTSLRAPE
jgi:NAD(P)-dependent dehydrogenase (short-subunit alcohol dehydrogenase family)